MALSAAQYRLARTSRPCRSAAANAAIVLAHQAMAIMPRLNNCTARRREFNITAPVVKVPPQHPSSSTPWIIAARTSSSLDSADASIDLPDGQHSVCDPSTFGKRDALRRRLPSESGGRYRAQTKGEETIRSLRPPCFEPSTTPSLLPPKPPAAESTLQRQDDGTYAITSCSCPAATRRT
jgi:hypothetical protein